MRVGNKDRMEAACLRFRKELRAANRWTESQFDELVKKLALSYNEQLRCRYYIQRGFGHDDSRYTTLRGEEIGDLWKYLHSAGVMKRGQSAFLMNGKQLNAKPQDQQKLIRELVKEGRKVPPEILAEVFGLTPEPTVEVPTTWHAQYGLG